MNLGTEKRRKTVGMELTLGPTDCFQTVQNQICEFQSSIPIYFYRRFKTKLNQAKSNISQILQDNCHQQLRQSQRNAKLSLLKENMAYLQGPPEKILQENILQFYLQLLEMKTGQQAEQDYEIRSTDQTQSEQKSQTKSDDIVQETIEQLQPLVYDYFVFKQYANSTDRISSNSMKSLNRSTSFQVQLCDVIMINQNKIDNLKNGDDIIDNIEKKLSIFSLKQLLERLIEQQRNRLVDSQEICRICERKIKLKNLIKHIKVCSSKAQVQSELNEIKAEWQLLYKKVIEEENKVISMPISQRTQKQNHYLRILQKIKKETENEFQKKKITRRSSHLTSTDQKNRPLFNRLEDSYQIFKIQYSSNQLLEMVLQNRGRDVMLQKKKNSLEINELVYENSQQQEEETTFKSLSVSVKNLISGNQSKTKKSLFGKSKSSLKPQQKDFSEFQSSFNNSISSDSISSSKEIEQKIEKVINLKNDQNNRNLKSIIKCRREEVNSPIQRRRWKTLKVIPNVFDSSENSTTFKDFEILRFLGKGAFGNVYLARRIQTKALYALKHIKYDPNKTQKQVDLIKKEHQIFKKIAGDHLIKAPYAFSEQFGHFFVLQYMPGGDLSTILTEQVYFQEDQAKFYLAQTVLALEHLHNCGIIHRDLKPQNLVLDKNGHLKLTDFGLSEIKIRDKISLTLEKAAKCSTNNKQCHRNNRRVALVMKSSVEKLIGTPDYIAPEIINQTSVNNQSIDWWSLGVLTYEMLVGCRPFSAQTIEEVLDNIIKQNIIWPEIGREQGMISPEAYDFISKLLVKDFQARLGSLGSDEIKKHPFFKGIQWELIKTKKAPFNSDIKEENDFLTVPEDITLREEIIGIKNFERTQTKSRAPKLDTFVRYDLLLQETFESVGKQIQNKNKKLRRLQSLTKVSEQKNAMNSRKLKKKITFMLQQQ